MITMKGYKAFNSDLTCLGYQYQENQLHVYEGTPVLCESGFHFCTDLQDVLKYYSESTIKVYEIEASGIITNPEKDCSKRSCSELRLVKELSLEDVKNSITKSEHAYNWALWIGDREHMKQFITESKWAYYWARYFGDIEYMKQFINDSEYAYCWAKNIGDREHMKQFITDSEDAYYWINFINPTDEPYFKEKGIL